MNVDEIIDVKLIIHQRITIFIILFAVLFSVKIHAGQDKSGVQIPDESVYTIAAIEVSGNRKTREGVILQEMTFSAGDRITKKGIEASRQAIMNLGLFEATDIVLSTAPSQKSIATVIVKEKSFNFVLPRLSRNGEGDITTGLSWRSDNLFGLNQSSEVVAAYRKYDDTAEDDSIILEWSFDYPRIIGSEYGFQSDIGFSETALDETIGVDSGRYRRHNYRARLLLTRWLRKHGPSRGLNLRGGWLWQSYDHDYLSGAPDLFNDIDINGLILGLTGNYVEDHLLSRTGKEYGIEFTWADDIIGSDINYDEQRLFYRRYLHVTDTPHTNLNYQFNMARISRPFFTGIPQFEAGGSRQIRGYSRDNLEGNIFAIVNVEFLRPINEAKTVRAVVFADAGNIWEDESDIDLDLKYAAGLGLRWKIKRFVKTDLRLDFARGLSSDGESRFYLGTRSTF